MCVLSLQSCVSLWDPGTVAWKVPLSMGFFQARMLEWVAISSFSGSSNPRIEPMSLMSPALAGDSLPLVPAGKPHRYRYISSVQLLSRVQVFATPWTVVRQASLSISNSWSLLKLMSIHLILCLPLLLLPSVFPASEPFPMSQFFESGGQSIGVSASTSILLTPRTDLL